MNYFIGKVLLTCFLFIQGNVLLAQYELELENLSKIDELSVYPSHTVARQLSSYDTTGGNDDGFSGKYSYLGWEEGKQLIGHLKGPGIIQRIWTPTPTNDTIQFYFDGETKPRIEISFIDLFSGKQFPFIRPIVGNEVGGYYCYLPIPFKESCKILYKGKMQFFQIQYIETTSERVAKSFTPALTQAEKKALETSAQSWKAVPETIKPTAIGEESSLHHISKRVLIKPGETVTIFETEKGGRITGMRLSPKTGLNAAYKDLILKASWDGESIPAIHCPLTDFFGYAFGKPAMKALPLGVHNTIHYSRLPMPFDKSASIQLQYLLHRNGSAGEIPIDIEIEYSTSRRRPNEGKLYAVWKREKNPPEGKPYQILQYKGRGHYVGTILQAQGLNNGMTIFFEGDDRTYIDGKLALHGTGSEDYFNGGWYALPDRWDQGYNLPTHGCLDYSIPLARTGGYRFYISDKISFEKDFLLTIEHGPENNAIPVDYVSVAFLYAETAPPVNKQLNKELLTKPESPNINSYLIDLLPVEAISTAAVLSRESVKDDQSGREYNVYQLEGEENAFVKFRLDIEGAGWYNLYASYFKAPDAGRFAVNQRQIPVKENMDGSASGTMLVEKAYLGKVFIENGTNTLTFVLKDKPAGARKTRLLLQSLYLEKTALSNLSAH